jgi:hypothetical protein
VRGEGGYVVAPNSVTNRGRYEWQVGFEPWDLRPPDMPPWLLALLRATAQKPVTGPAQTLPKRIAGGQRNSELYRAARSFHAKGLSFNEILAAIRQIDKDRCDPPLQNQKGGEDEIVAIAANASKQKDRPDFKLDPERQPADSSIIVCEDYTDAVKANDVYMARSEVVERSLYSSSISLGVGGKHPAKRPWSERSCSPFHAGFLFSGGEPPKDP